MKRAVLDELSIEHELRIEYLLEQIAKNGQVDAERLRDPVRNMRVRADRLLAERRSGKSADPISPIPSLALAVGRARLDHLEACLRSIQGDDVPGDVVVCGAGRGGIPIFVQCVLEAVGSGDRRVWIADEFRAPPAGAADLNAVRDAMDRFDVLTDQVRFVQGPLDLTLPDQELGPVALLYVGSRGDDVRTALHHVLPQVVPGGFVVIEDLAAPETARAVADFASTEGPLPDLEQVDWSTAGWRKPRDDRASIEAEQSSLDDGSRDLSIVVVFYNMRREAARTLHSLSRAYQRGIDDVDYEVIVVENGSDPDQKLDEAYVRSFGPGFRYLDMGDRATPSPVGALNAGIAVAEGRNLALMIDGAHVLTPGVLRFGLLGLDTYAPAIVGTQQWYVGPGQQPDALLAGYDQAYEDELFDDIAWPSDGYRLFDIGHFVGDRDWFDGLWESNCLFVPRSLIEQAGGFDPAFAMPGGGYANLELYERLGSTPGVTSVTILGEGSFHQAHGGTTTNQPEVSARHGELAAYSEHFEDLRGKAYRGHGKPTHYVGAMRPNTMRSRSRRRTGQNFFKPKDQSGLDGVPDAPTPMPQDLRTDFIEAFWNTLAWKQVSWLGWKSPKTPTDLFVYQELITRLRPEWVVETGTGPGGRALFLASVCDQLGTGTIVCVDPKGSAGRPEHDRITYVEGVAHEAATADAVRALLGSDPTCLVILGNRGSRQRVVAEFDLYSPLVPVGSYVVIEDTVVNGHPVWPGFGSGPMEAVKGIVNERANFASDHDLERYGLTFNPGGYLKRVR